jgi:hypothetical protein
MTGGYSLDGGYPTTTPVMYVEPNVLGVGLDVP